MTAKRRKTPGMSASDIRVGQNIRWGGSVWSVAAPAPESGKFWIHRWVDGKYESREVHVRDLSSTNNLSQRSPR